MDEDTITDDLVGTGSFDLSDILKNGGDRECNYDP